MENNIDIAEIEQMKAQLSELKSKLDKETIVNERLMRQAMKTKVSKLNRDAWMICIICVIGIPYCGGVCRYMLGMSWAFVIVTAIFFLAAIVYTYYSHKDVRANDLMEGNLIEVSNKIMRMKHLYAVWLRFSIPFLIIWLSWFYMEVAQDSNNVPVMIGMAVGAIAGGIGGAIMYRGTQRRANEIIEQIKELQANE
jgi:Ca2+/Na+ antiporter